MASVCRSGQYCFDALIPIRARSRPFPCAPHGGRDHFLQKQAAPQGRRCWAPLCRASRACRGYPPAQPTRIPPAINAILSNPRQDTPYLSVPVRLNTRREARDSIARPGCSTEGATDMPRTLMISFMLAATIMVLMSQSHAQSPDPALLAPGQSGRMLAPPRYTSSRPSYASAGHRDVFRSYRSLTGARLSHPSTHIH
jgi:hypothetical protein